MKKIAVDCRMIECSGIGTFLAGVLAHWAAEHHDFSFVLIGNRDRIRAAVPAVDSAAVVSYVDCDAEIFSFRELLRFPTREVNKCDIFFSPNFNLPLGIRIPIVSTVHDVLFLDHPELSGKIGTFIRRIWIGKAIGKSAAVLTVSEFSKQRIQTHFPAASHVSVCGNGIKDGLLNYQPQGAPLQQDPYFLYVGNVKPHKGLDTLLKAFRMYREAGGANVLKIVGEYGLFKTSMDLTGIVESDAIEFTGRVADSALYSLLSNADSLIQPSRYEGFGIPPLEAMALGTPVILSDIPVFRELYADFPVSFFQVDNPSDLLLHMQSPRARVRLNSSQIQLHTYQKVADRIAHIFNCI